MVDGGRGGDGGVLVTPTPSLVLDTAASPAWLLGQRYGSPAITVAGGSLAGAGTVLGTSLGTVAVSSRPCTGESLLLPAVGLEPPVVVISV